MSVTFVCSCAIGVVLRRSLMQRPVGTWRPIRKSPVRAVNADRDPRFLACLKLTGHPYHFETMRGTALANEGVQHGRRTQDAVLEWWSGCRTSRAACSQKTAVVIGLNRQKALRQRRPPTITEPWDFASVRHLRRGSPDRVPALTEGDSGGSYFEGEPVCASGTVCRCGGLDPALTECVGVVLSSNARAEP